MSLVTIVTACALTVDPKIMHALIWHQSGGEPWSFTVPGERHPRVYHTAREAIGDALATYRDDLTIRVGLTGLPASPRSMGALVFAPCPNITIAARRIAHLAERCTTLPGFKGDPIYCAIAAYRGSWDRPDHAFADAVATSVAKNDAPDFEMPADAGFDFADVGAAAQPASHDAAKVPLGAPDDRERGWSSALFPVKSQQVERLPTDGRAADPRAADAHVSDGQNARSAATTLHADGLFVPRSAQRRSP